MNNIEKILKKNKEVVAIVILLVLVWMMYRKAGYFGHNNSYALSTWRNDGNQTFCDGSGKIMKCRNSSLEDGVGWNINKLKYKATNKDSDKIAWLKNTHGIDEYCRADGSGWIKCDKTKSSKASGFGFDEDSDTYQNSWDGDSGDGKYGGSKSALLDGSYISGKLYRMKGNTKKYCRLDDDNLVKCNSTKGNGQIFKKWYLDLY